MSGNGSQLANGSEIHPSIQKGMTIRDPLEYIKFVGEVLAKSCAIAGIGTVAKGQALVAISLSEGVSYLDLQRRYHMTQKGMTMKADFMRIELRRLGGDFKWLTKLNDNTIATIRLTHRGETYEESYTIEQARKEGLIKAKTRWTTDPASMLRARCTTLAIRAHATEILDGFYSEDEIEEENAVDVPFETVSGTAETATAPVDPIPDPATVPSTVDQRNRIKELAEQLINEVNVMNDVSAMGVQALTQITSLQAAQLIDKYETVLAAKQANESKAAEANKQAEAESQTIAGQSSIDQSATVVASDGPVDQPTIDEIKGMINQLLPYEGSGLVDRIKTAIGNMTGGTGQTIADLSIPQAEKLKANLSKKLLDQRFAS